MSTITQEHEKITKEKLSDQERQYILLTQNGLPIIQEPYHAIAEQMNLSVEQVLTLTKSMQERGIIRRIAAVPNHYKLGYQFNGMTVWDIDDEQAEKFGDAVGRLPFVSHCYLRPRFLPEWNYKLFPWCMEKQKNQSPSIGVRSKNC